MFLCYCKGFLQSEARIARPSLAIGTVNLLLAGNMAEGGGGFCAWLDSDGKGNVDGRLDSRGAAAAASSVRGAAPLSKDVDRGAGSGPGSPRRLVSSAWPLRRYGRFVPEGAARLGSETAEAASASAASWKVLESDEKSIFLTVNIVASGHFFISQGRTLLEGFSLINAHKWLKIGRRNDCLLFGSKIKNESRMFRVQFGGESKEQALEHCGSCVQQLKLYVSIQVFDGQSQELLQESCSQTSKCKSQGINSQQDATVHNKQDQHEANAEEPIRQIATDDCISVTQLLKSVLKTGSELPLAYQYSACSAEELGPFLRLCLLDKNFPAFVNEVEKELQKLATDRENK
ncbi:meiotic recombination protein REC114 isoform X1 [Rhinatrema bivittatum]|uniref:meiotic recombination protein REC114 isoform X1 n=1 Tax=Rhinatrema bivittatum TaxID=194408 RepID=UPI00112B1F9C|nr:meiotic recombination protein REC114 isoform X1 [Rhinatrema bivittatum]